MTTKSEFRWVYTTEVEIKSNEWRTVGTYESVEMAVKHAEDKTEQRKARVRQFKESYIPETPSPIEFGKSPYVEPYEPLADFFCPTDGAKAKSFKSSKPRCPTCRQVMFEGSGVIDAI